MRNLTIARTLGLTLSLCLSGGVMSAPLQSIAFSVHNPRSSAATEVVRISLPVPAGLIAGEVPQMVLHDGKRLPVQAHVITRHTDGSVRRVMLSLPVTLPPGATADYIYELSDVAPEVTPLVKVTGPTARIAAEAWTAQMRDDALQLAAPDRTVLAVVNAFGPALAEAQTATLTVLENGPQFAWLRWRQDGADYSRELDLEVDRLGTLRLTQRLLRHLEGNGWAPDFGFRVTAARAEPVQLPEQPVCFLALPVGALLATHPELAASLRLADENQISLTDPWALLQHRGTLEAVTDGETTTVTLNRNEPVAQEMDQLQLQEGMWRETAMVLQPGSPEMLLTALDQPLITRVDWRAYDAVYHTGPPLRVQHPLLRRLVEKYVGAIESLSMKGDDWGSLGGLERYNHCQYIWEDYFRTSDPRLRRVALDYSRNYHDLSVNWGPNPDYYGGGRYPGDSRTQPWPTGFRTRHNDAVSFCTKGYHSFWLAYEETGDPRYRYAAEQQAEWSAKHVTAGENYTRCIGQVVDFVKMYEYTGRGEYLDQALRLWSDFMAVQCPDLLFTESGRPAIGNDLYVPEDSFGYLHPYVKSYITQYATNSLPYLLIHQPDDQRLRDTIIACNDWMARVQTAGGGWSYPGPTTAGFAWNIEYCHGLMAGYGIAPKPEYLDAIQRDLRAITALVAVHGSIPSGVTPWEYLAGKTHQELGQIYRLGTDRDRNRDFTDGRLSFGFSPDSTVYLQVLLRDYLRHRPETSLFTDDPILDQILRLPTAAAQYPQTGEPSLRIAVTARSEPEGLAVKLAAEGVYKLEGVRLDCRWTMPDGSVVTGPEAAWLFPQAGIATVTLSATANGTQYSRTTTITAPTGPGDLGQERWPEGIRVQAEGFIAQGGGASEVKLRTSEEKLGSDDGSISHWDPLGAWVDWEMTVPAAGAYYLLARYACPAPSRRVVSLDGQQAGVLQLPLTGGYSGPATDDWRTELLRDEAGQPLALQLTAGRHVLRLANDDGMGCNLDYLELLPRGG